MNKTLGQIAYEAYCTSASWRSLVSGAPLPPWDEVRPDVKSAWDAAAHAVEHVVMEEMAELGRLSKGVKG